MKVVKVYEFDKSTLNNIELKEEEDVKNKVFENVKKLYHITSNEKQIINNIKSKEKLLESKSKQLDKTELNLNKNIKKLSDKISEIENNINKASMKLRALLEA